MVDHRYQTCEKCGEVFMFVHICNPPLVPPKKKSVEKEEKK